MPLSANVAAFLRDYPQIYFACHCRHAPDPRARRPLSVNQASILDHLDGVEPTPLHSLAAHMGVTASTMSLNVDRLEKAGYVSRNRDRDDARRIELRLTEAGTRLKQRRKTLDPGAVRALLGRVPQAQRAQALEGLRILAAAAKELIERPERFSRLTPTGGSWGGKWRQGGQTTK